MKTRVMVTIILLQLSATISTENTAERIQSAVMESWKIFSRPDEENGEKQTDEMPLLTNLTGAKESETLNALVDSIIAVGVTQVETHIRIPNVATKSSTRILFIPISVSFKGRDGCVSNVKTLRRTGDTVVARKGDMITLQLVVGFRKLTIFFNRVEISVIGIGASGPLTADIHGNSFFLNVGITSTDTECKLQLNAFRFDRFDSINLKMEGTNVVFNWLRTKVSTCIANHFSDKIKERLEARVISAITATLPKYEAQICHLTKK